MKPSSNSLTTEQLPLEKGTNGKQQPKSKPASKPVTYQGSRYSSLILLALTVLVSYALYLSSAH